MSDVVVERDDAKALFVALGFKTAEEWDDARLSKKLNALSDVLESDHVENLPEEVQATASDVLAWNASGDSILVGDENGEVDDATVEGVREAESVKKAAKKESKAKSKAKKAAKAPAKPAKASKPAKADKTAKAKPKAAKAPAKPAKAKVKSKADKSKAKVKSKADKAEGVKVKKSPKKAKGGYGPRESGVIHTMWKFLCKASEKKPVSANDVFNHLIEKFPERRPLSMATTVNAQIPRRICSLRKGAIYSKGEGVKAKFWVVPEEE